MAEAELEDAVVGDGQREREGEAAGPAVDGIYPRRLGPGQLAEDPGCREELAAGEDDDRGGERGLQVDRVAEEEAEIALGAWLVIREQPRGERDEREREQRRREPAVRPRIRRRGCGGLAHSLLSNRRARRRSTLRARSV